MLKQSAAAGKQLQAVTAIDAKLPKQIGSFGARSVSFEHDCTVVGFNLAKILPEKECPISQLWCVCGGGGWWWWWWGFGCLVPVSATLLEDTAMS